MFSLYGLCLFFVFMVEATKIRYTNRQTRYYGVGFNRRVIKSDDTNTRINTLTEMSYQNDTLPNNVQWLLGSHPELFAINGTHLFHWGGFSPIILFPDANVEPYPVNGRIDLMCGTHLTAPIVMFVIDDTLYSFGEAKRYFGPDTDIDGIHLIETPTIPKEIYCGASFVYKDADSNYYGMSGNQLGELGLNHTDEMYGEFTELTAIQGARLFTSTIRYINVAIFGSNEIYMAGNRPFLPTDDENHVIVFTKTEKYAGERITRLSQTNFDSTIVAFINARKHVYYWGQLLEACCVSQEKDIVRVPNINNAVDVTSWYLGMNILLEDGTIMFFGSDSPYLPAIDYESKDPPVIRPQLMDIMPDGWSLLFGSYPQTRELFIVYQSECESTQYKRNYDCLDCNCHDTNSVSQSCQYGVCRCKTGFYGKQCTEDTASPMSIDSHQSLVTEVEDVDDFVSGISYLIRQGECVSEECQSESDFVDYCVEEMQKRMKQQDVRLSTWIESVSGIVDGAIPISNSSQAILRSLFQQELCERRHFENMTDVGSVLFRSVVRLSGENGVELLNCFAGQFIRNHGGQVLNVSVEDGSMRVSNQSDEFSLQWFSVETGSFSDYLVTVEMNSSRSGRVLSLHGMDGEGESMDVNNLEVGVVFGLISGIPLSYEKYSCLFYNESLSEWDESGVERVGQNGNVLCQTDHFSLFQIQFQVDGSNGTKSGNETALADEMLEESYSMRFEWWMGFLIGVFVLALIGGTVLGIVFVVGVIWKHRSKNEVGFDVMDPSGETPITPAIDSPIPDVV